MTKICIACISMFAAVAPIACGGGGSGNSALNGSAVSCTISSTMGIVDCQEIENPSASSVSEEQSSCNTNIFGDGGAGYTAQYSTSHCSTQGAVGGCEVTEGSITAVTWFYSPFTTDEVHQACASSGTFISP
jgi:hypothetical protein